MSIQLVEKQILKKTPLNKEMFNTIDTLAFNSKNLYNYGNYQIRQAFSGLSKKSKNERLHESEIEVISSVNNFIKEYNKKNKGVQRKNKDGVKVDKKTLKELSESNKYLNFEVLDKYIKESEPYRNLPAATSQQILRKLDKNWKSFFKSIAKWRSHPELFKGRPKLPRYKHKENGRNIIIFKLNEKSIKNQNIILPKSIENISIKTNVDNKLAKELRIVPRGKNYKIEVVYKSEIDDLELNKNRVIGIDLGLDNLATVSNNIGLKPFIIDGKKIKSINQYYNKEKAKLMSYIGDKGISNRLRQLTDKRNNRIDDYIHKSSKKIIDWCVENDIGTLIVGQNKQWKQGINIGKSNNQHFVGIPHTKLIKCLKYKAENIGMNFIAGEESYTSKASFLDEDDIPIYKKGNKEKYSFSGKRGAATGGGKKTDRLYKSKDGIIINADLNGAYNILKKHKPNAFDNCDKFELHPERIKIL